MPRSSLASISLFEHAPTLSCDAARVPVALDEAGTAKRTATCTAATAVHVAIRRRSAALGHAHDATHGRVGSDTGLWPAQQLARLVQAGAGRAQRLTAVLCKDAWCDHPATHSL